MYHAQQVPTENVFSGFRYAVGHNYCETAQKGQIIDFINVTNCHDPHDEELHELMLKRAL